MAARPSNREQVWMLPPLILHPFSDASGPGKLVESSRASLMLQGLLPSGVLSADDLDRKLLEGRFCELRMLYYVGKDLARWVEQCLDFVEYNEPLRNQGIRFQSFASLLVNNPPAGVREKLHKWGVVDHKAIFSRAFGIQAVFAEAPEREILSDEFIRNYYRYADYLFTARQNLSPHKELDGMDFQFDLYASGEYSRMLERQWEDR